MEEFPAVRCPPYSTKPLCLGCYKFLDKKANILCPACHWPMCSKACIKAEDHLLECKLFQAADFKMKPHDFNFEEFEPLYDIITPLRMWALKSQKPQVWKELSSLMDHLEQWKTDPRWVEEHDFICDFISENLNIKGLDQDMILRLFGIGYINDFSTTVGDARVRVSYPKVAMISHDCTPNVVRFISGIGMGNKIQCYASRPIKKGDKLSITYVDLLQPTMTRREVLKKVINGTFPQNLFRFKTSSVQMMSRKSDVSQETNDDLTS